MQGIFPPRKPLTRLEPIRLPGFQGEEVIGFTELMIRPGRRSGIAALARGPLAALLHAPCGIWLNPGAGLSANSPTVDLEKFVSYLQAVLKELSAFPAADRHPGIPLDV